MEILTKNQNFAKKIFFFLINFDKMESFMKILIHFLRKIQKFCENFDKTI